MSFIKRHWFNFFIALIILCTMGLTLLVAFSPKEDREGRGFIPCTKQLAENVTTCQNKMWCVFKAVLKNSLCDARVITKGIHLWLQAKQSTPWSNYFFKPDLSHIQNFTDPNAKLFYEENKDYLKDFEQVKENNKKLEELENNDKETK